MAVSDVLVSEPGTRLQNFLDRAGLHGFPWKTSIILYTISWGWLFIVRDSIWADDWFLFLSFDFSLQGFAPWVEIQIEAIKYFGLTFLRSVIFISFLTASVFLFGITRQFSFLSLAQRRLVVLLFLLLPFNTARVALMVFLYSVAYFFFFFGWYLLVSFRPTKISHFSLIFFFFSFQMHSMLFFYLLPIAHAFFLSKTKSSKECLQWLIKNAGFLLLPFLYWIMRSLYWPEEVLYHDVGLDKALGSIYFVLISGGLLLLVFVLQRKLAAIKQSLQIIFVGLLCIFVGIFAYVLLGVFRSSLSFFSGYIVTFLGRSDWYSRHQTLQPLGAALLIVGVMGLLPKFLKKFTKRIQALILMVCVVFNIGVGFEYVVDHSKQKKVISVLKEEGEGKSGIIYQFVDQTTLLNARGRAYRERDWKGLIWLAYGVESMKSSRVATTCDSPQDTRLVLIQGPETHWQALKNWVGDGDMGFEVTINDSPGACKSELMQIERVSGVIPILFYFTGAKG